MMSLTTLLAACSGSSNGGSTATPPPATENASGGTDATPAAEKTPDAATVTYKFGKLDLSGKDGALCGAPTYIALDQGFFAEEGFDVTLISADSETRKIGLNNGTLPIVNGDFQFFPSIEEGVKVKVVDGLHNGCIKFLVLKGSDIKSASDLKGKKIAVDEIGGTPHQVASVWVEKAGISADPSKGEVEWVVFGDGNLELEALRQGAADVAALWDPLGSVVTQSADSEYEVLFDLSTDPTFAGKYCCFLYASTKVIEEEPEKIAALLRAYRKAQEWIAANPKEAVEIISSKKYSAIEDTTLAQALVENYQYPSVHAHETGAQNVREDVKYFVNELKNIGYLKTDNADAFADEIYYEVDLTLGQ
jgi:NitT/TauT family transport system substrate-binding protein